MSLSPADASPALVPLPERTVLRVDGPDARKLLDGLLTCALAPLAPTHPGFGALLTPQGKIITDMLIVPLPEEDGGGLLLDVPVIGAAPLLARLALYRLRADVTFSDLSDTAAVAVSVEGGPIREDLGVVYADPRLAALGPRVIMDRSELAALAGDDTTSAWERWHARRVALGVPDIGKDFDPADTFPHEALMDQLGGVDFRKGCYVGQEVVSRMEHRGTARTRLVPVVFENGLTPLSGVEVRVGERRIGRIGSAFAGRGLAMVRLDRLAEALQSGEPVTAGGLAFSLEKPAFIRFAFPGEAEIEGKDTVRDSARDGA